MPVVVLALVLAAAVAHASWNFFAKGARGSVAFTFTMAACAEVVYLPLALGVYLWTRPSLGWEALLFVGVSGALNAAYFLLLTEGYRLGDLSLVYPLARGTGPALSVVGAIVLFGERPTGVALAGAALVVAGIIVMSWAPGRTRGAEVGRSVFFALATGTCIATYTLWDSKGVTVVTPVLYCYGLDMSRALMLAPLALSTQGGRAEVASVLRTQLRPLLAIAVLSPGAYILVLAALTISDVSYVAPAREISILFGALLGLRLLGEGDARRRLLGAGAIVAGIFGLAIG